MGGMGIRSWWRDIQTMPERDTYPLSLDGWAQQYFGYMGNQYPLLNQTMPGGAVEPIGGDFQSLASGGYRGNSVIFACMLTRFSLFSEARFQFRQLRNGRPGDLFGTADLAILENPWPGGTTGDLLRRAITDVDLAGNSFTRRDGGRLERMRPDWVDIILGSRRSPDDPAVAIDCEVVGYAYYPGGKQRGNDPVILERTEVAHFAPIPDPLASFRGMSWLTPVVREVMADTAATEHKLRFFENGATVNLLVKPGDPNMSKEKFEKWIELFNEKHQGAENAYRTLFLGGGADATVIGADLKQIEFKATQGAGETRIAAAAGIHPAIVGLSEGMQGSSLNAGNFGAARRIVADRTLRPLWRDFSHSMQVIVPPPPSSELWYDEYGIAFLREDEKDAAEIQLTKSTAIKMLIDAGFEPESVVAAVMADDYGRLTHTHLFSVQLQPPGTMAPEPQQMQMDMPAEASNGHRGDAPALP